MSEKTVIVEGYQPIVRVQDGYQPTASAQNVKGQTPSASTPVAMVKVIPPQGGTGEVVKKNNGE